MITSDNFLGGIGQKYSEFFLVNYSIDERHLLLQVSLFVLFRFRFGSADLQSAAREYASFYLGIKTERHENLVPFI